MRRQVAWFGLASLVAGCLTAWAEGEGPREGDVRGKVITVGENLVIEKKEGGQMILEPGWKQVEGKWGKDQDGIAFFKTLSPGDEITAVWRLQEGQHFVAFRIAKLGADGKPVAEYRKEQPKREEPRGEGEGGGVNALREEIRSLRNEIAQLRELIQKLVEQRKGQ